MEDEIIRLAAIDMGSNAVRLVIGRVHVTAKDRFLKREASYRIPLRLGDDVFRDGSIPAAKIEQLRQVFMGFQHLLAFFAPKAIRACSTSAMREASNGVAITEMLLAETGIRMEIISGKHEAELLFMNKFDEDTLDSRKTYLFVDVGGGSTELTLMDKGRPLASESFRIGTVRSLQGKVLESEHERLRKWVENMPHGMEPTLAIGTGGNIGKIYDMTEHSALDQKLSRRALREVLEKIESTGFEDRIRKLGLKPDRADVIVPAGRIYYQVMKIADIKDMVVPKVGVSDGILQELYQKYLHQQHMKDAMSFGA